MKAAWTKTMALALLMGPLACIVSLGDGDDDDDGFGGSLGVSGRGGSAGTGAGGDGTGGVGGSGVFPTPTCDPEPQDETDECVQCFKRNCCTEWLDCDDQDCTNEWIGVAECVVEIDLATEDDLGMCISLNSAAGDGLVQENTQALIDCATTLDETGFETLCSSECFGTDIFYE